MLAKAELGVALVTTVDEAVRCASPVVVVRLELPLTSTDALEFTRRIASGMLAEVAETLTEATEPRVSAPPEAAIWLESTTMLAVASEELMPDRTTASVTDDSVELRVDEACSETLLPLTVACDRLICAVPPLV